MITPSLKDLHDAIMTNSSDVVENYVKDGHFPLNLNHASLLPHRWSNVVDSYGNCAHCTLAATNGTPQDSISALHLAVINCFHNYSCSRYRNTLNQDALDILTCLLAHGADVSLKMNGIYLGLANNGNWTLIAAEQDMTPLQLAVFFKKNMTLPSQECMLNSVTSLLLEQASPSPKQQQHHHEPCKIHATSVPTVVLESWRKMLFESQSYDVTFQCKDGTTFKAHRCILSASSEYFNNYFQGPWAAQQQDGSTYYYKTSNSPQTMWAVLQFMYTGVLTEPTVAAHAQELLCVAHEYQLHELFRIVQSHVIQNLHSANVKVLMQLAHLHGSRELEEACFAFVRAHAAQTLTQPEFVALANEDAALWKKLSQAVSPNNNNKHN